MLDGPPRCLQQQPVLGIHQLGFPRRHPEERRIETGHVIDEAGPASDHLAGCGGVWIEELVGLPAVRGNLRYRVATVAQHVPVLVCVRGAGKSRGVSDDREARGWPRRMFGVCHANVLPASAAED